MKRILILSRSATTLVAIVVAGLIIKIIPLLEFGPFTFGYDYGFYRRYLLQPVVSFPNPPVPGLDHTIFLPRIIFDCVRLFFNNPETILYIAHTGMYVIGIVTVWFFAKLYLSEKTALYASLLYVLSSVQHLAYTDFLFKQMVAVPLFVLTLIYFERKRYIYGALSGIAIVLTQQTSAVIVLGILGTGFLVNIFQKKLSPQYIYSLAVVACSYFFMHPHVAQKIASPPVGIFLSQGDYLLWSLPLFVLSVLSFKKIILILKRNPILTASLLFTVLFVVFHLPFYKRIYVFLDLFLVIPGALGIEYVQERFTNMRHRYGIFLLVCTCIFISIPLVHLMYTHRSTLDIQTSSALTALMELPTKSSIITPPELLPWVQGWSTSLVFSPGNLKEPHLIDEWESYWAHQDRTSEKNFLMSFPQPLYIFARVSDKQYIPLCAQEIHTSLYVTSACTK